MVHLLIWLPLEVDQLSLLGFIWLSVNRYWFEELDLFFMKSEFHKHNPQTLCVCVCVCVCVYLCMYVGGFELGLC